MIFIGSKEKFFSKYVLKSEYDSIVDKFNKINLDENHYFRVGIGDIVYDVSYRDKDGKFVSDKSYASREKTKATAKKVTKTNFMYVQNALKEKEMFETIEEANEFISKLN